MKGSLYLIPSLLSENSSTIPAQVLAATEKIDVYIVENVRTARRFLIKIGITKKIDDLTFLELNKHTDNKQIPELLIAAEEGKNIGLITEAGCPGIADPGAEITKIAHERSIKVIPLSGPSSIFLALMASGLNGQHFVFHGYLPIKSGERIHRIRALETQSIRLKQTQIFIETPYRNQKLLEDILYECKPSTRLCIATNITGEDESVETKKISEWNKNIPDLHKKPTVFLFSGS